MSKLLLALALIVLPLPLLAWSGDSSTQKVYFGGGSSLDYDVPTAIYTPAGYSAVTLIMRTVDVAAYQKMNIVERVWAHPVTIAFVIKHMAANNMKSHRFLAAEDSPYLVRLIRGSVLVDTSYQNLQYNVVDLISKLEDYLPYTADKSGFKMAILYLKRQITN